LDYLGAPKQTPLTCRYRIKAADPNYGAIERKVFVAEVEPELDPGIREEQDEETAQVTDPAETDDPGDGVTEKEADVTEVRSEPQQREERKEEIAQLKPTLKTVNFNNGMTMDFALIPAGEFTMNCPSDQRDPNTASAHMVRISKSFYMSVYEVTQQQYEKVLNTNPSRSIDPNRPVETVSWRDAQRFCQKLSSTDGGQCRLPTEAEWEYAYNDCGIRIVLELQ